MRDTPMRFICLSLTPFFLQKFSLRTEEVSVMPHPILHQSSRLDGRSPIARPTCRTFALPGAQPRARGTRGMTVIELMFVVGILGLLAASTVPSLGSWIEDQRTSAIARSVADMLALARAEAMRTGQNQLLLFNIAGISTQDAAGNPIENTSGQTVTAVTVTDLFAGVENCALNSGDQRTALAASNDFTWGVTQASTTAPLDAGGPAIGSGTTFARPATPTVAVNGLLFRPNGIPVTFNADGTGCLTIDAVGSGGGALYITNGRRDYAIVQSPLGGTRFHVWRAESNSWSP